MEFSRILKVLLLYLSGKWNLIFTLLFRAFKLSSNFELFYQEILNFKDIFKRNRCPCNFIDVCITGLFGNIFIDKKVYAIALNNDFVWVLPFIGKKSLQLRSTSVKSVHNNLGFCHLKVVFQSPYKLRTSFCFKDTLEKKIRSNLIYCYLRSSCNATYYGKTYQLYFIRAAEHMGILNLTGKRFQNVKESAVSENL